MPIHPAGNETPAISASLRDVQRLAEVVEDVTRRPAAVSPPKTGRRRMPAEHTPRIVAIRPINSAAGVLRSWQFPFVTFQVQHSPLVSAQFNPPQQGLGLDRITSRLLCQYIRTNCSRIIHGAIVHGPPSRPGRANPKAREARLSLTHTKRPATFSATKLRVAEVVQGEVKAGRPEQIACNKVVLELCASRGAECGSCRTPFLGQWRRSNAKRRFRPKIAGVHGCTLQNVGLYWRRKR